METVIVKLTKVPDRRLQWNPFGLKRYRKGLHCRRFSCVFTFNFEQFNILIWHFYCNFELTTAKSLSLNVENTAVNSTYNKIWANWKKQKGIRDEDIRKRYSIPYPNYSFHIRHTETLFFNLSLSLSFELTCYVRSFNY